MFQYMYVKKNDGRSSPYSSEQSAIQRALGAYYESNGYSETRWSSLTIEALPCDDRSTTQPSHYPDLCWHYLITVHPPHKEGTDDS